MGRAGSGMTLRALRVYDRLETAAELGHQVKLLNAELAGLKAVQAELRLTVADTRKTKAEPLRSSQPAVAARAQLAGAGRQEPRQRVRVNLPAPHTGSEVGSRR